MASLSEYLEAETLDHLAGAFSDAAGAGIAILAPDGSVLAGRLGESGEAGKVKVVVAGEDVGAIAFGAGSAEGRARELAGIMRGVLVRLCEQSRELRTRIEELAAMYRLTNDFAGKTNVDEVYPLAAEMMVEVTGADACSIRVLNEERTELLRVAGCGLSDDYMALGPVPLADSEIDKHIIETGHCVWIEDERTDPRVLYKAQAKREGIVSALCVPMSYRGRVEGVIRVYTRRVHRFDWFAESLLRGAASQAGAAIANARLYGQAVNAETMRRQLRLAGDVQRRMIPPTPPQIDGLDIAAIYVPCFELGGDFYEFIELADGNLGVCVADVVGKGVRAAMLMSSLRAALRAHATHLNELTDVLAAVNEHMHRNNDDNDFVTIFYGVLDVANRRLTYCNAGHEPGLLVRDGHVRRLDSQAGVIGIDPDMEFAQDVVELEGGDVLSIYTDGLPEAMNFEDEAFGRERIGQAALAAVAQGASAEAVGKHLLWEMRRFAGLQTRFDDLTLVTIKVE